MLANNGPFYNDPMTSFSTLASTHCLVNLGKDSIRSAVTLLHIETMTRFQTNGNDSSSESRVLAAYEGKYKVLSLLSPENPHVDGMIPSPQHYWEVMGPLGGRASVKKLG